MYASGVLYATKSQIWMDSSLICSSLFLSSIISQAEFVSLFEISNTSSTVALPHFHLAHWHRGWSCEFIQACQLPVPGTGIWGLLKLSSTSFVFGSYLYLFALCSPAVRRYQLRPDEPPNHFLMHCVWTSVICHCALVHFNDACQERHTPTLLLFNFVWKRKFTFFIQ